jgi:hypothetical protein
VGFFFGSQTALRARRAALLVFFSGAAVTLIYPRA